MEIFASSAFWQAIAGLLSIVGFLLGKLWRTERTKNEEAADVSDEIYHRSQEINQALAEGRAGDVEEAFRDLNRRARVLKRMHSKDGTKR